ncbi:MAG: transposase [Vicinamibacterales bacterium]
MQRFGGALNLNVHIHALVLDGMFARAADGYLAFHPAATVPTAAGCVLLITFLDESALTQRILRHLGLPAEVPQARPARAPPRGRLRGVAIRPRSTVSPVHNTVGVREAGGLPSTRYAALATAVSCARPYRDPGSMRVCDGRTPLIRAVSGPRSA